MNFAVVLRRIAGHLESEGFPCALIGGLGLAAFGIARATLDLDLLVPGEAQESLVRFMETQGYETLYRSGGYSNHLHADPELGRVDFVYVKGQTREQVFAGAARHEGPGGLSVLVPRPEHVAAMKVLAMKNDDARRYRDLADIAELLRLDGVDRDEIRGYFARHDLLAWWDELQT